MEELYQILSAIVLRSGSVQDIEHLIWQSIQTDIHPISITNQEKERILELVQEHNKWIVRWESGGVVCSLEQWQELFVCWDARTKHTAYLNGSLDSW